MEIHLIVLDVVVCLTVGVRESLFHHQGMSDDIDDIQDTNYHMSRRTFLEKKLACAWVCRGLDGFTCLERLPERTCDFERPEHVPRTSARAQTFTRVPCGVPECHGAEKTRKRPQLEKGKNVEVRKKNKL